MAAAEVTVVKRSGEKVPFETAKVKAHIEKLMTGLDIAHVCSDQLAATVEHGSHADMSTAKVGELLAQAAAYKACIHPDYSLLAGRIAVSILHKETDPSLLATVRRLHGNVNPKNKEKAPLVTDEVLAVVEANQERLQAVLNWERDFAYEYFGYKTLERAYLLRVQGRVVERPQHMLMRVAIGIHGHDLPRVIESYELLSQGYFTHATPTLFHAGTPKAQLASCFLLKMREDSIEGIFDTLKQCAVISKYAGGIGLNVHNIRASGSYIRGSGGNSSGIVPMLRVFNDASRYVDQGGKRKGAMAMYLEPWHSDVLAFLNLKKNTGKEEVRARDLFYAMWIPDLFMKRVQEHKKWTLFDPNTAKGLADVWGEEFEKLYEKYEAEGMGMEELDAQKVWFAILEAQIETGTPYMLYKDSCNRKSNQQHLGTIRSSNLCTEIVEYTNEDEVAVCNLASIALPKFLKQGPDGKQEFDHGRLREVVHVIVRNLNNVIDRCFYPVKEAEASNMKHRPIGIGIQGLADLFILMRLPFACPEAQRLNTEIFETIYYSAVEASVALAKESGPFASWQGCPMSKGVLQFDMWGVKPQSGRWEWEALRKEVVTHGVRNSLLVAPMPTASTSQILGNNECFEPFTSNIYVRRVLSGEFPVVNKYLVKDMIDRGLWGEGLRNQLIAHGGSVQRVEGIPQDVKELYRTVWEIKQKDIIEMAAARAVYIDQSQSLNLFLETPTTAKLTAMHFFAWKKGLKTGMYYLRSRPAADAIKFTVDQAKLGKAAAPAGGAKQEPEECIACGS
eukprot:TRINITY_DN445_c0_g1_i3.p1 TRINITY_DN445_c0_g1~~TRINITY_DN445_c0_g1_i3.p1  ORF type:complete len:820 (+),score=334.06 TRINITY_DN445_c0_g1_i3:94-2460(+)